MYIQIDTFHKSLTVLKHYMYIPIDNILHRNYFSPACDSCHQIATLNMKSLKIHISVNYLQEET